MDKKGSRAKKLIAVSATAVLTGLAVAVPVLAATPPVLPRDITIFPERDFVAIDGYRANTNLNVSVISGGVVVGTAQGTTDRTGFLEVNHPGGVCWNAPETPDIQPGDRVQVRNNRFNINDSNRTINVTAEQAFIDDNGTPADDSDDTVKVHGTAQTGAATPARIDITRLEQRIIQPDFIVEQPAPDGASRITRRDIRADSLGGRVQGPDGEQIGEGNLSYDSATFDPNDPNRFDWTATYTGLNAAERQLAVDGQTRILSWLAVQGGERAGITIFEVGEVGGPGFGGCPPGPGGPIGPNPPDAPPNYDVSALRDSAVAGTDLTQLHEVVVFPERDFVVAEGYPAATNLNVVVRRGDGIVGTASGTTDAAGIFEVNHPGGACWTKQTPDIQPGDQVDVFQFNDPDPAVDGNAVTDGETQRTINVTAGDAVRNRNGTPNNLNDDRLIIKGTAVDPTAPGGRVPLDKLEQRIIQPELVGTRIGRRDIRANSEGGRVENVPGGSGRLAYDSATSRNWTATYRGLNNQEILLALEGQVRILSWHAADAGGERYGITIFEQGEAGGPGFGGCPQTGDFSIPLPQPPLP